MRSDLFLLNLFSCRILLTCRRVLGGLQIDEYNIAGRHHRCVVAIPLACSMIVPGMWECSAQAVVDRRDHPCGHKNRDELNVPDDL